MRLKFLKNQLNFENILFGQMKLKSNNLPTALVYGKKGYEYNQRNTMTSINNRTENMKVFFPFNLHCSISCFSENWEENQHSPRVNVSTYALHAISISLTRKKHGCPE